MNLLPKRYNFSNKEASYLYNDTMLVLKKVLKTVICSPICGGVFFCGVTSCCCGRVEWRYFYSAGRQRRHF